MRRSVVASWPQRLHLAASFVLSASATLIACADRPAAKSSGHPLDIQVAPLHLAGIAFACYDVTVRNGDGDLVWSKGDPAQRYPKDTTTLCSAQFGNGPGGDIAYVGTCDATAPDNTVTLVVDGLYDDKGIDVADYANPCPASAPCVMHAQCEENADASVVFDLTIVRAAHQGFFDVAVNFDNIFCSAKVDCADPQGKPIELLFDPATGQRTQTVVMGLACTAGPESNITTSLLMDDVRVVCGGDRLLGAGASVLTCSEDGSAVYGVLESASTNTGFSLKGIAWGRDSATGAYVPADVAINDPNHLAAASGFSFNSAAPIAVLDGGSSPHGLAVLIDIDASAGSFDAAVRGMRTAVIERTSTSPETWEVRQILAKHLASPTNAAFALDAPAGEYVVTRDGFNGGSFDHDAFYALYPKGTGWSYGDPVELRRDYQVYHDCIPQQYPGRSLFVSACVNSTTSNFDMLVWDLASAQTGAQGEQYLAPMTIPLTASDFVFDDGLSTERTALSVDDVEDFGAVGSDRVFATVRLSVQDAMQNPRWTRQLVHFVRGQNGTWTTEPGLFGRANLANDPTPHALPVNSDTQTSLDFVVETDSGDAFIGLDARFPDGNGTWHWTPFIAHYHAGSFDAAIYDHFRDSGTGTDVNGPHPVGGFFDTSGTFYVFGTAQTDPASPLLPWYTAVTFPESQFAAVTWLPLPQGDTLIGVDGLRGATSPSPTNLTRRISGGVAHAYPGDPTTYYRHAIEWRLLDEEDNANPGTYLGFQLDGWSLIGPSTRIPEAPSLDHWTMRDLVRARAYLGPRFDTTAMRCPQLVTQYGGDMSGSVLIADTLADATPNLPAVSLYDNAIAPTVGSINGVLDDRDLAVSPLTLLPSSTAAQAILNPAQPGGNVWSATHPRPQDLPAQIIQMASYHGEESLNCGTGSCNKLYWNTAIAFDPKSPDCELEFEATAARSASLIGGKVPAEDVWPILVGRVPLTTSAGPDGNATLACGQHPLGSQEYMTIYKPQGVDLPMCYEFGPSGGAPSFTDLNCKFDAAAYMQRDQQLKQWVGGRGK